MADGGGGGTDHETNMMNTGDHLNITPPPINEENWRGCTMDEIHRHLNEFELEHIAPVRPTDTHTVLHHYPIREGDNEPPRPLKCHPKWDALHVRLPCSSKSQYPVTAADGSSSIESRWEMIEKALLRPITNSHELEASILAYNSRYDGQWNFRALHCLFEDDLDESETQVFFEDLLPRIIRLALRLPELVQAPIPLLKQGQTRALSLTQQQISCLLANAFLCTFPRRNTLKRKSEYSSFPDINFNRLFQSSGPAVLEKIKCICHYFRRVCPTERDSSNVPTGVVTFARRSMQNSELPSWTECEAPLGITPLHITSIGTIEDQGLGLLQVDFANKFLGGGVLGSGCVQEEIRFVICPELLVSKLFTECLRPTESLLMVGCERYSNYTGYAGTFQWTGNHEDATPRDSSRRRHTHIVAIDALHFVQTTHQYREELMLRELNKAYVGFFHPLKTPAPGVASGNWGCGAFGGHATLKALLQLMVCTVAKRPLVYFTFGNVELRDEVHRMHTFFMEQNVRVKDLWKTLTKFQEQRLAQKELYNFIYSYLRNEIKHSLNIRKTMAQQKQKNNIESMNNSTSTKTTTIASSSTHTLRNARANNNKVPIADLKISESINKSQDIFASSSDSENENIVKISSIVVLNDSSSAGSSTVNNSQTSSMTHATRILISDDSETDALLVAATNEASAKVDAGKDIDNYKNLKADTLKTPTKVRAEPRQRTLLEMLDQCYTVGGGSKSCDMPATKRHKTAAKK